MQTNVRVAVQDFGPIASADMDLRPLTVFVGPSNTGKTYMAVLIYALHRTTGGFSAFPLGRREFMYRHLRSPHLEFEGVDLSDAEIARLGKRLMATEQPFKFSDLPQQLQDAFLGSLRNPGRLGSDISSEFTRCFDIEKTESLIRSQGSDGGIRLKLEVLEGPEPVWQFDMRVAREKVTVDGQVKDIELFGGEGTEAARWRRRAGRMLRSRKAEAWPWSLFELLEILDRGRTMATAYYLPAARSGIMQSHRVIASSLVARSTRAGFERFELPTFSGVMADFMQRLILHDEGEKSSTRVSTVAKTLEREALAGEVLARRTSHSTYPEFVYRPRGVHQDIRLSRASSMVSELAPVVLFLRSGVGPGDTFIIEEPEAHLHPGAQTQMAVTIGRLVRVGVRVVVTTHSDWLLKELGNLIRQGELADSSTGLRDATSASSWLKPHEVGVWLFNRQVEDTGSTVEEIPFDRVEGIEPEEYEDVEAALYNRSAELQNRLQEEVQSGDASQE